MHGALLTALEAGLEGAVVVTAIMLGSAVSLYAIKHLRKFK